MDAVEQRCGELVKRYRLVREAEWQRARLKTAVVDLNTGREQAQRITDIIRRHDDRIDRRQWTYARLLASKPIVTTAQVAEWVRANITNYRVVGGADPVEVAGDVTNALNLWDEHESIPSWVHGVCEREVARDRKAMAHSRNFFVEKKINYEPDGQVLWA
jgi:hypothetical protein